MILVDVTRDLGVAYWERRRVYHVQEQAVDPILKAGITCYQNARVHFLSAAAEVDRVLSLDYGV